MVMKQGVAFLDLSTGEFYTSMGSIEYVDNLLQNFNPSEVIYEKTHRKLFAETFREKYNTYCLEDWVYTYEYAYDKLTSHFKTTTLKGFGIENLKAGSWPPGQFCIYLEETEHRETRIFHPSPGLKKKNMSGWTNLPSETWN